ncbi:hypothetical protein C2S51_019776 [Perilla frutescens var. frutescens]|nr:hypothetical protein C2S51_019776 [Perilla frutescens var. frutescens]
MAKSQDQTASYMMLCLGDFASTILIPAKFVRKYKEIDRQVSVMLENDSGKSWNVKFKRMNGDLYMTDGWPEFVKENGIIEPGFLTFHSLMLPRSFTFKKLPIGFVRKHRNFLPENATLRIGTGKIWSVKIEEYSDDGEGICFFTEGWSDFVRDLDLQKMQMLVFFLNIDEAIFDITVYEANANEMEFSAVDFPIPESNNVNYESDGESRPRFEFVLSKEFATAAGLNDKKGVVLQFEDEERYWPAFFERRTTVSLDLVAGWNDFVVNNRLVLGTSYSFEFDSAKKLILVSIRRRSEPSTSASASAGNGEKTWRFVKKLKEYNFKSLRMEIPKPFALGTGIGRKGYVKLQNSRGMRGWMVNVTGRGIEMFSMTQGWIKFLRENNLKPGNILLFEFVADSDDVVKVTVMESKVGEDMLARAGLGGLIWF